MNNQEHPEVDFVSVGVVIVGYASAKLLGDSLSGVLADPQVKCVVVVDNSSEPESRAIVQAAAFVDPRVSYFDPGRNLGFAGGCNRGVELLDPVTHVFFVNPDAAISQRLSALAEKLKNSSNAIVGARLRSPEKPRALNARDRFTPWRELQKAVRGSGVYTRPVAKRLELNREDPSMMVGQVDGALLGISFENFQLLGGFDESFELYYEDVDLCARAETLGGTVFFREEWGTHVGGASFSVASEKAYCLSRISRIRYVRKHYGTSAAISGYLLLVATAEFAARSVAKSGEPMSTRRRALRMQLREILASGTVSILG